MSDTTWNFQLSKAIGLIVDPMILALKNLTTKISNIYTKKDLILTGDVSGSATIIGTGVSNTANITTTIDPSKHTHNANTLPASVSAQANTIVKRDAEGRIYSAGTNKNKTGYCLADGTDIGTLFRPYDMSRDTPLEIETIVTGEGMALTNAYLTITDDYKIELHIFLRDF